MLINSQKDREKGRNLLIAKVVDTQKLRLTGLLAKNSRKTEMSHRKYINLNK